VDLGTAGARATEEITGTGAAAAAARVRGTASDIVLALYGRQQRGGLDTEGDRELATRLLSWTDNE